MFPVQPRECFESAELGRIDGEKIYHDCLGTTVTDL